MAGPDRDVAFLTEPPSSLDTTTLRVPSFFSVSSPSTPTPGTSDRADSEAEDLCSNADLTFRKTPSPPLQRAGGRATTRTPGKAATIIHRASRNEQLGMREIGGKKPKSSSASQVAVTASPCRRSARGLAPQNRRVSNAT